MTRTQGRVEHQEQEEATPSPVPGKGKEGPAATSWRQQICSRGHLPPTRRRDRARARQVGSKGTTFPSSCAATESQSVRGPGAAACRGTVLDREWWVRNSTRYQNSHSTVDRGSQTPHSHQKRFSNLLLPSQGDSLLTPFTRHSSAPRADWWHNLHLAHRARRTASLITWKTSIHNSVTV